jgi:hypothetical protein
MQGPHTRNESHQRSIPACKKKHWDSQEEQRWLVGHYGKCEAALKWAACTK